MKRKVKSDFDGIEQFVDAIIAAKPERREELEIKRGLFRKAREHLGPQASLDEVWAWIEQEEAHMAQFNALGLDFSLETRSNKRHRKVH